MTGRLSTSLKACALLVLGACAQAAYATDLMSAWQDAQASDPGYAAARAQRAAGVEALPQARAALLPRLQAALGVGSTWASVSDLPRQEYTTNGYGASLVVPVFHWGDWQGYEIGKLKVARSEIVFEKARQALMIDVARAYFDVLQAQDQLAFSRAHEAALDEQLKIAQAAFDAGTQTVVDLDQARAALDLARAERAGALNDYQIRTERLNKLVGHPVGSLAALPDDASVSPLAAADLDQWTTLARQRNLDVATCEIDSEMASRETRRAQSADLPTVDLIATFNHSSQGNSRYMYSATLPSQNGIGVAGGAGNSSVIGLQITIPIFTGGYVQSRKRETLALESRAGNALLDARENAVLDARQTYLSLLNGRDMIAALRSAVVSTRTSTRSAKTAYEIGDRTSTDVLIAEDKQYRSRTAFSRARYDYMLHWLELSRAAGQLTDAELANVNALLTTSLPSATSVR
ncbi:TolC family outer membrane protein [Burkholderia seminalis]|uniref:TolC family outer membrane protein n=1 Tax=Burkholderia seminalis TaxID=488731 RepID=UPI001CF324A7|nr:TolC family outer membrane protein [Burkholderia seminalis]MCA8300839.1 TolC family outer membrane protein [Burkholderia seminalis]